MTVTWWHDQLRSRNRTLIGLALAALLAVLLARLPLGILLPGLAGAALLIAVFVQPAVGLIAVGLALPLGTVAPSFGPAGAMDLLVALVVMAWLARGISQRGIYFYRPPLAISLLVFVWCAGLSLTQAVSWSEGLPEWLKWIEFSLLYLAGCQVLGRRWAPWAIAALLAAGLAEAALGAYQFVRQVGPEAFILSGRFMRAYGTFSQPNPYAGYLGYLFPVSLSLSIGALARWWTVARADRRPAPRALLLAAAYGATAAILATGIVMSWSRGAWLGLIASGVVVAGFRSKRNALLTVLTLTLLALLIAIAGTGWLPGFAGARLNDLGNYFIAPDPARTEITDANFSVLERLAHWQAGLRMFGDHPWLGIGIGNYGVRYAEYELPHWYVALGHAHNVFINFLAETGILGTAAFVLFWLSIPWLTWRTAARQGNSGRQRLSRRPSGGPGGEFYLKSLAIGIAGTWTFVTVHNLFDNLFVQHIQLQLALLLVALVAAAGGVCHPSAARAEETS